jgi:hypothetical protein
VKGDNNEAQDRGNVRGAGSHGRRSGYQRKREGRHTVHCGQRIAHQQVAAHLRGTGRVLQGPSRPERANHHHAGVDDRPSGHKRPCRGHPAQERQAAQQQPALHAGERSSDLDCPIGVGPAVLYVHRAYTSERQARQPLVQRSNGRRNRAEGCLEVGSVARAVPAAQLGLRCPRNRMIAGTPDKPKKPPREAVLKYSCNAY